MRGSAGTNDLVSDGCQCVTAIGGADWNGDDDARRTLCPDCSNCSFHCRASRQAIVHQQDDAIVELERGPAIAIRVLSTRELGLFFTRDVIDDGRSNAVPRHNILVENPHAAGGDRTHRKLAMAWQAELSDEEDIERRVECAGDFVRHRHASARQREHHDVVAADKVRDVRRQLDACVPPVFVWLPVRESCGHESVLHTDDASRIPRDDVNTFKRAVVSHLQKCDRSSSRSSSTPANRTERGCVWQTNRMHSHPHARRIVVSCGGRGARIGVPSELCTEWLMRWIA